MKGFFQWCSQPHILRRFHGVMTILWLILIIPSVLLWKDSIIWIIIMSAWANFAGHFSSWQAARVEVNQQSD